MGKANRNKKQIRQQASQLWAWFSIQGYGEVALLDRPETFRSLALIKQGDPFIFISKDQKGVLIADSLSLIDGVTLMCDTYGVSLANENESYLAWRDRKSLTANREETDFLLNGTKKRLHIAAVLGLDAEVERLVGEGWDLEANMDENHHSTPLVLAVLHCRAAENLRRVVSVLLDSGAIAAEWMVDACRDGECIEAAALIEANLLAKQALSVGRSVRRSLCRI